MIISTAEQYNDLKGILNPARPPVQGLGGTIDSAMYERHHTVTDYAMLGFAHQM